MCVTAQDEGQVERCVQHRARGRLRLEVPCRYHFVGKKRLIKTDLEVLLQNRVTTSKFFIELMIFYDSAPSLVLRP